MSTPAAIIHTQGLTRQFPMGSATIHALRGVDFRVADGEFVALMGASGSGKSTLLHLLGCLDRASSGAYWLEGRDVANLNKDALAELRGRRIGFIFQSFNLLPRLAAWENVALPLLYQKNKTQPGSLIQRSLDALERVGLQDRADHLPAELSGGERQRVAIARALVTNPAVLLADEPTGNLDSATGADIMRLLDNLHAQGCTIVLVTHDLSVARHATRICTLRDGSLFETEASHVVA